MSDIPALVPKGKRLVPEGNEPDADLVFTPDALAGQVVAAFAGEITGDVLDPARGSGAFYHALPSTVRKHWRQATEGRGFFDWTTPVDRIITNPPRSIFRPFLAHAMQVADNVLFLTSFNHYATRARVTMIRDAGFAMKRVLYVLTPRDWLASGFQLAVVYLQRGWDGPCRIDHLGGLKVDQ